MGLNCGWSFQLDFVKLAKGFHAYVVAKYILVRLSSSSRNVVVPLISNRRSKCFCCVAKCVIRAGVKRMIA